MEMPELKNYYLVGSTALSLKLGHRKTSNLVIYTHEKMDTNVIEKCLKAEFGNDFFIERQNLWFVFLCIVKNINVEFVYSPHPPLPTIETIDGIRMHSNKDIAIMKVLSLTFRGEKKHFWDIAELLKEFSIEDLLQFIEELNLFRKLPTSIPNTLINFEEAENSPDPVSLKGQTWVGIKKELQAKVREFLS